MKLTEHKAWTGFALPVLAIVVGICLCINIIAATVFLVRYFAGACG